MMFGCCECLHGAIRNQTAAEHVCSPKAMAWRRRFDALTEIIDSDMDMVVAATPTMMPYDEVFFSRVRSRERTLNFKTEIIRCVESLPDVDWLPLVRHLSLKISMNATALRVKYGVGVKKLLDIAFRIVVYIRKVPIHTHSHPRT